MPQNHLANPYSSDHVVQDDGSVAFACSLDAVANPWLQLPPHHAVVVQTQSFWTAVGASIALQGLEATQWTALTWIDWELGEGGGGHAVRGEYRRDETSEQPHYSIVLFNADGEVVVSIKGRGVIFRNRNFEEWREGSKKQAREKAASDAFTFAPREDLGLVEGERVFVASYDPVSGFVDAVVTATSGFPPGNRYIGGSGDHVNSTHIHEIARQALCLVKGRSDIDTSGEMTFDRYVELGVPLRLNIKANEDRGARFELEQLGRVCSTVELRW